MNTWEIIQTIERDIKQLAGGEAPDHNSLTDEEYKKCAEKCDDLSQYLDSIAESFVIAASPECTALLAEVCRRLSETR